MESSNCVNEGLKHVYGWQIYYFSCMLGLHLRHQFICDSNMLQII